MWSWNKNFGTWDTYFDDMIPHMRKRHYFKTRRWLIMWMLRMIIKEFFTLIMEDMILHNDVYKFPKKLGMIQISYHHPASNKYIYDLKKQGRHYTPVFAFTEPAFKKTKVQYYVGFTRQWKQMLRKEILNNHTYELIHYEHFEFKPRTD